MAPDQDFTPNMDPPEGGVTPAVFTMPTEADDSGYDCGSILPFETAIPEGYRDRLKIVINPLAKKLTQLRRQIVPPKTVAIGSTLVSRAEWGARPPKSAYQTISGALSVTFHYEGPTMGAFDHSTCAAKLRSIQNYHMDTNALATGGAIDIAYSMMVCPHGYIFMCRGYHNRTAAQGNNTGNATSYAVCYLAGVGDPLTDPAKSALLDARKLLQANGGATKETHVHSDWFQTSCPGDLVRTWVKGGLTPPPGYSPAPDPYAPQPSPNGGSVLSTPLPDAIGFIDDPTSDGGWLVTKSGGIYTKAPSQFYGSLGGVKLNAPIAAFLPTPSGKGYWLFGEDGGVFAFGDAPFNGTYAQFATEYAQGIHRVAGAYFRGNPQDRSTWRYSFISSKLESYDI